MTGLEALSQLIAGEQELLRATMPTDRPPALAALVRARDAAYLATEGAAEAAPPPDEADQERLYGLGWNWALQLCFEAAPGDAGRVAVPGDEALDTWADRLIRACGRLGEAELVLAHGETGYLQLQQRGEGILDAWVATRRMPTEWREREDFAWWTAALARRFAPDLADLTAARPAMAERLRALVPRGEPTADRYTTDPAIDDYYRRLGTLYARRMANQYSYPADAAIGGVTFQTYLDLLGLLIGWLLRDLDLCAAPGARQFGAAGARAGLATPRSEARLVEALATALALDQALVREALRSCTLDAENAAYHGALPGGPAPPLLRLDADQLLWSGAGLLTEPFLFVTRELKRRHAQEYHNTAYLREGVFRQDLYGLFADRRFVKSAGTVELKRAGGGARTDLDALIFDRKSGTLGIFELKAQDPFARSTAARARQRDNFYHANKQISAIAQWLQRNDATGLLARVDARAAKTFKVQRVQLFVLG
ncbi:MAG TPA: hypothetical protein VFW96_03825, partial [Thermomicrobiales bacterium]|nr:hypothetical protein [Thermomicrobiales bacterium]